MFAASTALFTDSQKVDGNSFTAGTVDLDTNPTSSVFQVPLMAPGDVVTEPITVRNKGSLAFRYALESVATGPLVQPLRLSVKSGVADCTNAGFGLDGTSVYSYGYLGSSSGTKLFGNKATGPDVGDRVLDPGKSESFCVQATLPGASTGNEYQSKSADAEFRFYAEQIANNGLVLPPPATSGGGAAQSLLVANMDPDQTSVDVAWPVSRDPHVVGYNVYRTNDNGASWQQVATLDNPAAKGFVDRTTSQGTTYGYALQSIGFDGTLSPTPKTPASSAVVTTPWLTPAAASGVSATATPQTATVTWVPSSSGWVTGYQVLRSTDNGATWKVLSTVDGASTTSYSDTDITQGATYLYGVKALGKGDTAAEQATSAKMSVPWQAPATPGAVTTTAATSGTNATVTVKWGTSAGPNLTGYTVYRSANNGTTWAKLTTVTSATTSYADTTAEQGSTYVYGVIADGQDNTDSARVTSNPIAVPWQTPTESGTIATTATPTQVVLTWGASTGPNLTGYTVYRSTNDGSTWTTLGTVDETTTTYTDKTVTQGETYTYSIIASGKGGNTSKRVTSSDVAVPYQAPAAPTSVTVIATTSGSLATGNVSWSASAGPNLTGYTVYRSTDGGSTWTLLTTTNETSYADNTANQGNTYLYSVIATGQGNTVSSRTSSVPLTVPFVAPAAPASMTATPSASGTTGQATLSWAASGGPNLVNYTVYRSTNGGSTWAALTTTNETSYADPTAAQGTTYLYSVIANGKGGLTSARTTATSVTVPWVTPAAVASVSATASSSGTSGQVVLSWPASAGPNLTDYTVYRSSDSGSTWTALTTTSSLGYTDNTPAQGSSYVYAVVSNGQGGLTSAKKTSAEVTIPWVAPAVVASVSATPSSTGTTGTVTVGWPASTGPNITGYTVYRSTDSGSTWTTLGTTGTGTLTYTDNTPTQGSSYLYAVATNGQGGQASAKKNSASVTIPWVAPAAVTSVSVTPSSTGTTGKAVITWPASAGPNLTGYAVSRSTDGGSTWTTLTTTATGTLTYTDSTPAQGSSYLYSVIANGQGGLTSGRTTSTATAIPWVTPAAVGSASATANTTGATVTWTASAGPNLTGYTVKRSADNGTTWTTLTTTPTGTLTYADTTANPGTSYVYGVVANGQDGQASAITKASAVTVVNAAATTITASCTTNDGTSWTPYNSACTDWSNSGSGSTASINTTAVATSNPMLVTDTKNADVALTEHVKSAGNAIYARVTDGNNFVRARVNELSQSITCSGCGSEPTGYFTKQVATNTQVFDHYSVLTQTRTATTMYSGTYSESWSCSGVNCVGPAGTKCPHDGTLNSGTWGPQTTNLGGTSTLMGSSQCQRRYYTLTSTSIAYGAWSGGSYSNLSYCPGSSATVNYTCTAVYRTDTTYTTQSCTEWYYSDSTCENGGYTLSSTGSPYRSYDTYSTEYDYYLVLEKGVNGTVSQLANTNLGTTLPNYIRLTTNGSTLKTYYGATADSLASAATVTDVFNQTATKHGLGFGRSDYSISTNGIYTPFTITN